jgi:hypothetical protein
MKIEDLERATELKQMRARLMALLDEIDNGAIKDPTPLTCQVVFRRGKRTVGEVRIAPALGDRIAKDELIGLNAQLKEKGVEL